MKFKNFKTTILFAIIVTVILSAAGCSKMKQQVHKFTADPTSGQKQIVQKENTKQTTTQDQTKYDAGAQTMKTASKQTFADETRFGPKPINAEERAPFGIGPNGDCGRTFWINVWDISPVNTDMTGETGVIWLGPDQARYYVREDLCDKVESKYKANPSYGPDYKVFCNLKSLPQPFDPQPNQVTKEMKNSKGVAYLVFDGPVKAMCKGIVWYCFALYDYTNDPDNEVCLWIPDILVIQKITKETKVFKFVPDCAKFKYSNTDTPSNNDGGNNPKDDNTGKEDNNDNPADNNQ